MIRLAGRYEGHRFILLGLSRANIERLVDERQPIKVDGSELGFEGEIYIVFGETEEEIAEAVAPGVPFEDRR